MTCPFDNELQRALKAEDMSDADLLQVGIHMKERLNIVTARQYIGYFGAKEQFLVDFWMSKVEWHTKGTILANMRNALVALNTAKSKKDSQAETLLDVDLDNPIDKDTNKSLAQNWEKEFGFRLHPSQEGNNQILGSMWRRLQLRQTQAEAITGIQTLESTGGIKPGKRLWKMGDMKILVDNEEAKDSDVQYHIKANPFHLLCAMESYLRTFTKAGCYYVKDPEDDRPAAEISRKPMVLMVDREIIEEHLANCRSFILEWTTSDRPPSNGSITNQLARIDLRLREKWTKLFRENKPEGKTFTRCIRDCEAMADAMWSADISKDMVSKGNPKGGKKDRERGLAANFKRDAARKVRKDTRNKGNTRSTSRGSTQRDQRGSKGAGKKRITMGPPIKVANGKSAKTANKRDSKEFCRFFAEKKCSKGKDCRFKHECPVLLANDKVCEGNHSAKDHKGPIVQA